jgi:hypothetical protein
MIRLILLSLITSLIVVAMPSHAKQTKKAKTAPKGPKVNLSTDIRFDADNVYGKYQFADEALATVEDEKLLSSLIGVRADFKDRLQLATKKR